MYEKGIIIYKTNKNSKKKWSTESYQKQDSAKSMIKLNAVDLYLFQLI